LAALSARTHHPAEGSGDIAAFVEAFSGSHSFVIDYLVDEVLAVSPVEQDPFDAIRDAGCGRPGGRKVGVRSA
jgi:LuxR family maltose regulon positive regulatory protein